MTERFRDSEKASDQKPSLEERLKQYPGLQAKIETLLGIMENAGGDIEKAAEAERRIIEAVRVLRDHTTRKNRHRGGDLHRRAGRAGAAALFRIGGSAVPRVLGRFGTSHRRFWCGRPLGERDEEVARGLRDRSTSEHHPRGYGKTRGGDASGTVRESRVARDSGRAGADYGDGRKPGSGGGNG